MREQDNSDSVSQRELLEEYRVAISRDEDARALAAKWREQDQVWRDDIMALTERQARAMESISKTLNDIADMLSVWVDRELRR